jgi:cytochrome P450
MATPVHELDLPVIDLNAMGDRSEIRAALARARDAHWLARAPFGYVVTHYQDIVAVLRDRRFHSAVGLISQLQQVSDEKWLSRRRQTSILSAEGDEHGRLRRLVAPAFTPVAADRLRPRMREVIGGLLDRVTPTGRSELVTDVCEPYPIPIICALLGAPEQDWQQFSRWATDILKVFSNPIAPHLEAIMTAQDEIDAYVRELIAQRRHEPREDLLTDLIAAEEAGDRLSPQELVTMVEAVIIGGTDTTRNQLACTTALFSAAPDQWALLAERPDLAPRAVEESMRLLGAVRGTGRFASEDIEYRDVLFPRGTLVFPNFVSGNTEAELWPSGDRLDLTAPAPAQPHLSFGSGIHYCLGAWLARAELQEALPLLAQRMPDLRVDGEITWKPMGVGIWGPERLPLAFSPTPATGGSAA